MSIDLSKCVYNPKSPLGELIHGRSLLKLYKVFLEEYLKFAENNKHIGLCVVLLSLSRYRKTQEQEWYKLKFDFYRRAPIGKTELDYWFNNKEERILFIESIIKELENEK